MMTMCEKARKGIPLTDVLVIDEHCHMGAGNWNYIPDGSAGALVAEMDNLGIDIACVCHSAALAPDFRWGNDRVIEAMREYPGRFAGYCTINPHYPEDIVGEMERCFLNEGMKGIKLHPWAHERTLAHKNYRPVFEFAETMECFVMVHTYSQEEISNMDRLASEYPTAVFIMAHTGGEIPQVEIAIDVINRHENIYTDIAVSESREGNVEWLTREIGSKKLLFGTDMPFMDPRATFSRVAMAEISEDEKRDIFGLNMRKLLSRRKTAAIGTGGVHE
jgi:predicted TIM-barrel fold metal-dependent hydrolase